MATKELTTQKEYDDIEDQFIGEYQQAIIASQLQDSQRAEQAFINGKMIFTQLEKIYDEEEKKYFGLVFKFIETVMHMLRSVVYISEERYQKAITELETTNQLCDEALSIFNNLSEEELEDLESDDLGIFEGLRFNFALYKHLAIVQHGMTQKSFEASEGKYVNEVDVLKATANAMRKFNIHDYINYQDEKITRDVITGIGVMLNRFADTYEKKAERIVEKRKTIEFVKPINNKVFIIHGHDEGLLRELREILTNSFKIEPVILKYSDDNGKTIIEKLEYYGKECAFAFAIVTPDDIAENKKKKVFQARPNVLYELGWFSGRYGRSRIRILKKKGTALPSDLDGLIAIEFNDRIEEIFRLIGNDLKNSGVTDNQVKLLSN